MQKLKLNLEDLSVNTFETAAIDETRGTIHGAADESRYCGATIFEYIWYATWLQAKDPVQD